MNSIHPEKQIRLVLKILSYNKYNGMAAAQISGVHDQFVTVTKDGAVIWAGTVDLQNRDGIYDWICYLGQEAEILHPTVFKQAFQNYCLQKLHGVC